MMPALIPRLRASWVRDVTLSLRNTFAQVIIHGARTDEQLRSDVAVGEASAGEAGDLGFPRGQHGGGACAALAGGPAGSFEFDPGGLRSSPRIRASRVGLR
jgi:hypothetical protein